ncbi:MAG TPA: hypothetical protein VKV04_12580 [Verrucomicrobiae bacterium]|nr:hypothetical protein [Verrucomicrobiae bacterium]
MNTNLKLARQFGIATACAFAITVVTSFICAASAHRHILEAHSYAPFVPAMATGAITAGLAIITFALFVAAVLD